MIWTYVTLQTLATTLLHRGSDRAASRHGPRQREAGVSTLEVVVIALGLFLIATALVAAITVAVNSRMNQIQ